MKILNTEKKKKKKLPEQTRIINGTTNNNKVSTITVLRSSFENEIQQKSFLNKQELINKTTKFIH